MSRARLNLLIDAVIGIAFLVTAATGVVFLLPASWQQTVLVGLSFQAWHWLHDWSGAVAAAGVALHLALHWRWVVHTARRWLADAHGELPDRRPAAGRAPAPSRAETPHTDTPSLVAARTSPPEPRARRPRRASQPHGRPAGRLTRRGFIVGAAGFGAALIGGVGLSKVVAAASTDQTTAGSGTSTGQSGAAGSSSSGATGASTGGSSSSGVTGSASGATGASSGASSSGSGTTTTAAPVVVDSPSCIACGHCLQVCPKSVFAWNGDGRATALSPDSCILCHRCVQVCPASAITLNA